MAGGVGTGHCAVCGRGGLSVKRWGVGGRVSSNIIYNIFIIDILYIY